MAYIDIHDQPGQHRDFFYIPAKTAVEIAAGVGGVYEFPIWHAPFDAKIRDVVIIWATDLVGNAGDYTTVTVRDKGTAGTDALIETTDYDSGAITGFDAYALYDPTDYYDVDDGGVISVRLAVGGGAGEDMPDAIGFVEYEGR